MSPRSRATFSKRQKEQARQEKQRAKAERKQQRKLEAQPGGGPPIDFDSDQFATEVDDVGESESPTESATNHSPTANAGSPSPSSHNLNSKEFS